MPDEFFPGSFPIVLSLHSIHSLLQSKQWDGPTKPLEAHLQTDIKLALQQLEREKGIPKEFLLSALEQAMASALRRRVGEELPNLIIRIDTQTGKIHPFLRKTVVPLVADLSQEITLEQAKEKGFQVEVGDSLEEDFPIDDRDLGRLAAQAAKQVMLQKLREAEDDLLYEEYKKYEGKLISGTVHRREGKNVFVDLGKLEGLLPKSEQAPTEPYRYHERYQFYLLEVRKATKGPTIILSRTQPDIVRFLFAKEVPEIQEGIVQIKSIAREPGYRTKMALTTTLDRVDPVGACVGTKGVRVQPVVDELRGEKIDIIRYNPVLSEFIKASLSPATISEVKLNPEKKSAVVIVPDDQLSLGIGRGGQNVRLAARLCGIRIDIFSETQYREREKQNKEKLP